MFKQFDSSYTGFTEDGAKWLVDNTDIKLVGEKGLGYVYDLKYCIIVESNLSISLHRNC